MNEPVSKRGEEVVGRILGSQKAGDPQGDPRTFKRGGQPSRDPVRSRAEAIQKLGAEQTSCSENKKANDIKDVGEKPAQDQVPGSNS